MQILQTVRGTHDVLQQDMQKMLFVEEKARSIAASYGFFPVQTPIFESVDVFLRPLGDAVAQKEMYTFADRGGQTLALRPEGTASIVRAFIQNGLQQKLPFKAFYCGPMFRYERPQKGRQRQFSQFGVEFLGLRDARVDVEIIAMAFDTIKAIGVDKDVSLHISTLGDGESRTAYRCALVEYLQKYRSSLSKDSRRRLQDNPLRILDSKDPKDKQILKQAPAIETYLNSSSRDYFFSVLQGLEALNIPHIKDPYLVRGFDYYCHTTFEFITPILGAQGTVLGGGRYDNLCAHMGGLNVSGIGYAAGIERLTSMLRERDLPKTRGVVVVTLGGRAQRIGVRIATAVRNSGIRCECAYEGTIKKQLKFANAIDAKVAVIIGEDEIAGHMATVRDLDEGIQKEVALSGLAEHVVRFFQTPSKS